MQELSHYQVVVRHCRQEKAKYTEELEKTCREIEQAVYEMEEKQQTVLSQWRKINEQERSRIIFPVVNGVEKMAEYVEKKGCGAMTVSGIYDYGRDTGASGSDRILPGEDRETPRTKILLECYRKICS